MGFFDKIFGGGKKTPFTSDPQELIRQQENLSRFNIEAGGLGRRFFTKDETGRSVLNIEETPFQKEQRARREALASTFLTSLEGGDDRFAAETKRIGDVTFERGLSRLEPFIEKRRRAQEVALASQGLPIGSEIRGETLAELGRDESDLLTALAQEAELSAGAEQSRLRNLASAEALGFFGEEIGGIDPNLFSNVANVDSAGIATAADANRLARFQQEATRQNTQRKNAIEAIQGGQDLIKGAGGLSKIGGGLAGFFSDERVKENVELVGSKNGFNIYEYDYIKPLKDLYNLTGRYRGVMAQEIEKTHPEAVEEVDGIKKVFYHKLGMEMEVVQ